MRPSTRRQRVVKVEVPAEWAQIDDNGFAHVSDASYPEFVRKIVEPINGLKGDDLPVSAFTGREDGTWENGTAAYEKRGIAVNAPSGRSRTVSSATSAPMSARTP